MSDASAAPRRFVRAAACVAAVGLLVLGARLLLVGLAGRWLSARHPALGTLDLSFFYDGRLYLLVARSFPFPYQSTGIDPVPVDYTRLTIYSPLLPAAIWSAAHVVGGLRPAAFVVPMLAAGLSLLCFERLARRVVSRSLLATALFAVFPPDWLLVTSLPFSESMLLLAALAAVLAFAAGRPWTAAACAGLAAIAQKNGFLIALVLVIELWRERRDVRALAPWVLAALPALALQGYLAAVFGDPWINLRAAREIYGADFFSIPGVSLVAGLVAAPPLRGGAAWLNKLVVVLALAFYVGALVAGWRNTRPLARLLRTWVAVVLAFALALGGSWAYYNFSRFMVLAAPAAVLLWTARLEGRVGRAAAAALVAAAAAVSVALDFGSIQGAVHFFERVPDVIAKLPDFRDRFF